MNERSSIIQGGESIPLNYMENMKILKSGSIGTSDLLSGLLRNVPLNTGGPRITDGRRYLGQGHH